MNTIKGRLTQKQSCQTGRHNWRSAGLRYSQCYAALSMERRRSDFTSWLLLTLNQFPIPGLLLMFSAFKGFAWVA